MLLAIISVQAQEKGSYLTIAGGLGMNHFLYEMDNGRMGDPRLGYGGALGYQYFFTRHWGIGTGIGIAYYNTKARYDNTFNNKKYKDWNYDPYQFTGRIDDDYPHPNQAPIFDADYTMQLTLSNWTEKQYAYFLEIPLMAYYQTKWGEKQAVGLYAGLGAKLQLPIIYSKYAASGDLTVQGYYTRPHLTIDDLPQHGYGTADCGYKDDLNLKTWNFAATGELGFLIALNRRVDLTIGGYLDIGLNNVKDGNKGKYTVPGTNAEINDLLMNPVEGNIHQNTVGDGMEYNGIINSYVTDHVRLVAAGGKIGLRIKLGKLTEKKVEEEAEKEEMIVVQEVIKEPEPVAQVQVVEDDGISEADLNILSEPIFFDLAKHDLKWEAIQILDRKVAILKKYPNVKVLILGNTCDLGGDKINIPLGDRRANAARDYLEKNGIDGSRMSTVTQAANYPMLPNTNEQNRTKNRRDDFKSSGY